jgi:hypothetical protein
MSAEAGAPHPMDMDDNHGAGGSSQKEDQGNSSNGKNLMQGSTIGSGGTGYTQGVGQPATKSVPLFIIQAPLSVQVGEGSQVAIGVLEAIQPRF